MAQGFRAAWFDGRSSRARDGSNSQSLPPPLTGTGSSKTSNIQRRNDPPPLAAIGSRRHRAPHLIVEPNQSH